MGGEEGGEGWEEGGEGGEEVGGLTPSAPTLN